MSFPFASATPNPFHELFDNVAHRHFGVKAYYWQASVGSVLMEHHSFGKPCRFLCIQGTGSGKSILYQTLAAHFAGVTIYISPLLTLGADQVNKLMQKTAVLNPSIIPIHFDSMKTNAQLDNFLKLLKRVDSHASIVVFSSPQTITDRFPFFIDRLNELNIISFVVVDELHMFNMFGRSFRCEFMKLKTKLFQKVHDKVVMLFMTASCNRRIRASFEEMIGVAITHTEWPSAVQIANRKVTILCDYSQRPIGKVEKAISNVVRMDDGLGTKCIVYSNVRKRVLEIQERIGDSFDVEDALHQFDVLSIHGQLTKDQKACYIQTFLDPDHPDDKNIRVLCATSGVGNVGIDSKEIRSVFRLEFPPSILDFVQEMGRAGRVQVADPGNYSYTVYYSIDSFLYLYERALDPDNPMNDDAYRKEEVESLFEVGKMLVFQNECFYVTTEKHLGNPEVQMNDSLFEPCNLWCPVCRDPIKDRRIVPIVDRHGLSTVLFHLFNPPPNNIVINKNRDPWTIDVLVREVRRYPNSTQLILKSKVKGGISPDNIKRILFGLVLRGLLQLSYDKIIKRAVFSLSHHLLEDGSLSFAIYDDTLWEGMELK